MKKKKPPKLKEKVEQHFSKDDKYLVWEKNLTKGFTSYFIRGSQASFVNSITFKGFLGIPSGFYLSKEGWGFPAHTRGFYFVQTLREAIPATKKIDLVISKDGKTSFRNYPTRVTVTFQANDLKNLIAKLRIINKRCVDEIKDVSGSYLSSRFPKQISINQEEYDSYKGGEVSEVLNRKGIGTNLNEDDVQAIVNFFPRVFQSAIKGRKKVLKDLKIRLAKEGKKITDKVFLDEVISEFELKISKKTNSEAEWQIFLRDKVFPFLTNTHIIDRQNISVEERYPDFVLVDVYGFADIFEIKTPTMFILSYDKDHANYCWSPDMSKAISQVENYIDEIKENESGYVKAVKKKYDVDLALTRPKGYVIAGTTLLLEKKKEKEDFRRLRSSHKNVEFILFDELLENLKHIQKKLE